jgi:hypothetical protein
MQFLFTVPHPCSFGPFDFLLEKKNAVQQGLGRRWAARDIYVDWQDSIHASDDTVTIMIVTSAIRAAAHANNPFRIRHLIVAEPDRWRHLVRYGAGHDHNISLPWRCTEDDAESVLVISWH